MELSEAFNRHIRAKKINDYTIEVQSQEFSRSTYDFILRQACVRDREYAPSSVQFSEIDREVLEMVRNKLIDLGGKPPELAQQQPSKPFAEKPLRL